MTRLPLMTRPSCSTFTLAGMDTTSNALSRIFHLLAQHTDVQEKLRKEILEAQGGDYADIAYDDLVKLPYLDAVVREALRLHAPVTSTMRVAGRDDVVPVARPFVDRRGRACDAIRVRKGDIVTVPLQAMNKSREVWGEDAEVFRPERWLEGGEAAEQDEGEDGARWEGTGRPGRGQKRAGPPGLWGNMLTFLNGNPLNGNRACIGFRFAINE